MTADIIHLVPNPDPAGLIADFGHPNWPGWWAVIVLLITLQTMMLLRLDDNTQLRPSPRPPASRTVRTGPARTVRTARTRSLKIATGD